MPDGELPLITQAKSLVGVFLEVCLPPAAEPPARLHAAMRYAMGVDGTTTAKRIRPALVLAACQAVGGECTAGVAAMAAVELFHTYTLVHDDLPAMDDDDLRRGRPTVHKAFDEATAILCGDALLTLSLEVLSVHGAEAVRILAQAGGSRGVVGGQQDDLEAEGGIGVTDPDRAGRLERIHRRKTAALISACCELGGLVGGAGLEQRRRLAEFGLTIGLAFQVADDILDVTGGASLGKTVGKDAAAEKLTYVTVYGLEAARREAERLQVLAQEQLQPFAASAGALSGLAAYLVQRQH